MLGTGLQFSKRRNGDDRFYSVSRNRRSSDLSRRAQNDADSRRRGRRDEPSREKSEPASPASAAVSEESALCNLDRFLESVTPSVPAQYLSKMTVWDWKTCNVEYQPFFVLGDLWASFSEWSAYGAGVPLVLNDRDSVVQYYVPYLSGIQIYAGPSKSTAKLRRHGEESDGEYFRDSSSDRSSDSELDRGGLKYAREQLNSQTNDSSLRIDQLLAERRMAYQEGFSSDEGESGSSQGCLLFEYLAQDQPYCREPLADKISDLACHFPELTSFRSCDLLPSSWISVAWYPIYRIPTGPTLKDLDACFLTFHSLHSPITGSEALHPPNVTYPSENDGVPQISLQVFGLASYKLKAPLWSPTAEHQRLTNSLLQAADNWLNLHNINHPDYSFFCRR